MIELDSKKGIVFGDINGSYVKVSIYCANDTIEEELAQEYIMNFEVEGDINLK